MSAGVGVRWGWGCRGVSAARRGLTAAGPPAHTADAPVYDDVTVCEFGLDVIPLDDDLLSLGLDDAFAE